MLIDLISLWTSKRIFLPPASKITKLLTTHFLRSAVICYSLYTYPLWRSVLTQPLFISYSAFQKAVLMNIKVFWNVTPCRLVKLSTFQISLLPPLQQYQNATSRIWRHFATNINPSMITVSIQTELFQLLFCMPQKYGKHIVWNRGNIPECFQCSCIYVTVHIKKIITNVLIVTAQSSFNFHIFTQHPCI